MSKTVKLKAQFIASNGGTTYPGETIRVADDVAENLVRTGAAVTVEQTRPAPVATKPIADTTGMRGFAKLAHLRKLIRAKGAEPEGRTVVAMTEQLQALGA